MKHQTPELYDTYVYALRRTVESDIFMREAPYRLPNAGRIQGQVFALIAVLGVLVVAGLAIYLDHPWVGGMLVAFDIIGLAAVFNGNQGKRQPKDD